MIGQPDIRANDADLCPTLGEGMIARAMPFGCIERIVKGEQLIAVNSNLEDFFILMHGEISVRARQDVMHEQFALTKRGQFSGGISLIGRGAGGMVGCVLVDSNVLRVSRDQFRRFLAAEADIAALIIGAFIYRRVAKLADSLDTTIDEVSAGCRPCIDLVLRMADKAATRLELCRTPNS